MSARKGLYYSNVSQDVHLVNIGRAGAFNWQTVALGPALSKGSLRKNESLAKYAYMFRALDAHESELADRDADNYDPFDFARIEQ